MTEYTGWDKYVKEQTHTPFTILDKIELLQDCENGNTSTLWAWIDQLKEKVKDLEEWKRSNEECPCGCGAPTKDGYISKIEIDKTVWEKIKEATIYARDHMTSYGYLIPLLKAIKKADPSFK